MERNVYLQAKRQAEEASTSLLLLLKGQQHCVLPGKEYSRAERARWDTKS